MQVQKKGMLKPQISDLGNTVNAGTVLRANTKAHSAICTKRHAQNIRELTREE